MSIKRPARPIYQSALLAVPMVAIGLGYASTQDPDVPSAAALALDVIPIDPVVEPMQTLRTVNPSVDHIDTWMSSVGASAAVADLDGDAYANDICLVDPRSDSVSLVQIVGDPTPRRDAKTVLIDTDGIAAPEGATPLAYDSATQAPMGCLVADVDQDGWTDALVYFWGRGPVIFLNHGEWDFAPYEVLGPAGASTDWNTNTALFSDLNGDGNLDIFIGNYFQEDAQLLDEDSTRTVAMNDSLSRALNGGHNFVLLGQAGFPETDFEIVADAFAEDYSTGWTLAAAAADLNGDSLPELYVGNDFGPDRFFVNRSTDGTLKLENINGGFKGFTSPRSTVIGRDSFKGMGVTIADIDGDLDYDIYVSNITQSFGLFESQLLFRNQGADNADGVPSFEPAAEDLGISRTAFSWDNKVADLNNDGRVELLQATGFIRGEVERWPEMQELALANDTLIAHPAVWPDFTNGDISGDAPRVLFTPTADGRFANVAEASGLDDAGLTRGFAIGDFDGDGDLDWIEANQWADARLIVNGCVDCDNFVGLRLLRATDSQIRGPPQVIDGLRAQQDVGGTAAIGATALVTTASGTTMQSYVDGGNGHTGQSSTDIHFGLGAETGTEHSVTVTWRDADGNLQSVEIEVGSGWNTVLLP